MNIGWQKIGLLLVTLALVVLLVSSSCAPSTIPGEKVVKIGHLATFTGTMAGTQAHCGYGIIDYVKFANEMGGIDGIKLDVVWEDTAALIPRFITGHKRLAAKNVVITSGTITSGIEAIAPRLQNDEIACIYLAGFTKRMTTQPTRWVATIFSGFAEEVIALSTWIKENWTETRQPRLGMFICDTSGGWEMLDGARFAADEGVVDLVGYECIPLIGVIDSTVELLRLSGKNPDWIFVSHYGGNQVVIMKDTARLELQQNGIKFVLETGGGSEHIIPMIGADDVEGWYALNVDPMCTETHLPGMEAVVEAGVNYRGCNPERIPMVYTRGWITGAVMVAAVQSAVEEVGIDNLTGRDVRDALFSLKDFDTELIPPLTINDTKPYYMDMMRLVQFRGGNITPASDWFPAPRIMPYK